MVIRCPQCKLNQFQTRSGKCRRCGTGFPLEAPARKSRTHEDQLIRLTVMLTRKQVGLLRDQAAVLGMTREQFIVDSLTLAAQEPLPRIKDGLFWGVQWKGTQNKSRIHVVAVDRWRTICGHEFMTDGRLQLPLSSDRADHLCKMCELTYKRLVGGGWWGNVVLRPASSYTTIADESLTSDV